MIRPHATRRERLRRWGRDSVVEPLLGIVFVTIVTLGLGVVGAGIAAAISWVF